MRSPTGCCPRARDFGVRYKPPALRTAAINFAAIGRVIGP
jgi:hypothetical protein